MADEDSDLIDLLEADHHGLLDAVGDDEYGRAVVKHLTVERALLYPAVEDHLPEVSAARLEELRHLDRRLEESCDGPEGTREERVREHIAAQQELLAALRRQLPPTERQHLGARVPAVIAAAPTHPHPHIPDHGPLREAASEMAAVVDHIEDIVRRRDH